jgi:molecular chaperone Hsp33
MCDYVIRGMAADGQIRAFAATTRQMTEEARRRHNTSPVATAALGRLMCAAAMLGDQCKSDTDRLTLKIKGDGPIGALYAVANARGEVKGFAKNPQIMIHARPDGKLDVGGAVGKGELTLIRDLGLTEPYVGTCKLVNGEIAEDLTYYFALSEQTPTSVSLGVLMNRDNTVAQTGGFMLQLMPGATDELAARLEEKILNAPPVTNWLDKGMTPEDILGELLDGLGYIQTEKKDVCFRCDCSREKMESVLVGLGRLELLDLILSQETVQVHCDYCNTTYSFSRPELKALFKKNFRNDEKNN